MVISTDSSWGGFYKRLCCSSFWAGGGGELLPVQRREEAVLQIILRPQATSQDVGDELWAGGPQEALKTPQKWLYTL